MLNILSLGVLELNWI